MTVNYSTCSTGTAGVNFRLKSLDAPAVAGKESLVARALSQELSFEQFTAIQPLVKAIDVTEQFEDVIKTFSTPEGETPAGFRIETYLSTNGVLKVDLVRDISYDKNGIKRATGVIYSADSANPYEVAPIAGILGNLTCNPGIVYDLFINNPKANVGGKFKTLEQVMTALGDILGPGCDISVELNNPFEKDFDKIVEEIKVYEKILSKYRLVVKVPHMGAINGENVNELLTGDKKSSTNYTKPATEDAFRSHELCLKLRELGYRINYTLMFEPYQTALAMQAKPYFINSFIRHRLMQTVKMQELLDIYKLTEDAKYLIELREYLVDVDMIPKDEANKDLLFVKKFAEDTVAYRNLHNQEGSDGLDSVRHNLRLLKGNNLPDSRLIICSMEGAYNYPDIDKLLVDPEFADVIDRLVITAEPSYLARFASTSQVTTYQRRFMNAAASVNAAN